MNDTAKQNFLRFARDNRLDAKGELYGTRGKRLGAQPARTTIEFEISAVQPVDVVIARATKISVNELVFETEEQVKVLKGNVKARVQAVCTTAGEVGNGYLPGQITNIVDLFPYYKAVTNVTETSGGTEIESDERYRERLMEVPESFSVAGPSGAYEFWAKSTSTDIIDVKALSPQPGYVDVYVWTKYGKPTEELKKHVYDVINDRELRPLTDFVNIKEPEIKEYNVELEFYIDKSNEKQATSIKNNAELAVQEWTEWQKGKLGRDINTDELIHQLKLIGVKRVNIISPVFKVINENEVAVVKDEIKVIFKGVELE
nr:baseplate J/gp47 family protein [Sebaldella sp. S0638]